MKRAIHILSTVLYTAFVVAVLSLALLFLGTKIDILGYEIKIVKSGSMEPMIQTGSIVVVAPSESYAVGDVVTYGRDTRSTIPVTHRIVDKQTENGETAYITKGEANTDPDPKAVARSLVIGKVAFTLPYIGYVIEFARTPLGFALLIGMPALLIVLDEIANIVFEVHKYRCRFQKHKSGKSGKRAGSTGYRTPSRTRRPRDFPSTPRPEAQKQMYRSDVKRIRPKSSDALDMRHYQTKRSSV